MNETEPIWFLFCILIMNFNYIGTFIVICSFGSSWLYREWSFWMNWVGFFSCFSLIMTVMRYHDEWWFWIILNINHLKCSDSLEDKGDTWRWQDSEELEWDLHDNEVDFLVDSWYHEIRKRKQNFILHVRSWLLLTLLLLTFIHLKLRKIIINDEKWWVWILCSL